MYSFRSKTPKQKIIRVIQEEIIQIIHLNIHPVFTKEIQLIIIDKIQPVIFTEDQQSNIEEVIQQLEQYDKQKANSNQNEKIQEKEELKVLPYVKRIEQHTTQTVIENHTKKKDVCIVNLYMFLIYNIKMENYSFIKKIQIIIILDIQS